MRIYIEEKPIGAGTWTISAHYPNTNASKVAFEKIPPQNGMMAREHLHDHDMPDGHELRRGCMINEKKKENNIVYHTNRRLYYHFQSFDDVEILPSGKTARQEEADKIDAVLVTE